jgi:hypothetical protein
MYITLICCNMIVGIHRHSFHIYSPTKVNHHLICFNNIFSNNELEWLTLKWSATLPWLKPPLCMLTACHLSGMVNFRRSIAFGGHISTRTVIRRLHHQGMRARRPIKRPQLTLRHRHAWFDSLHQSYNDGMVNPEVLCHPSMAKTTVMHANSLPPFW